ncbi:MAG: EVE domain-containing protein, partial [Sphaerospermopsis kisseleviana]
MNYWLFQGNPKYYKVIEAIKDFEQMPWLVTRYAKDIAIGDGVIIWVSGTQAGIYA